MSFWSSFLREVFPSDPKGVDTITADEELVVGKLKKVPSPLTPPPLRSKHLKASSTCIVIRCPRCNTRLELVAAVKSIEEESI